MKRTRITVGTENGRSYLRMGRPLPGLFWGEMVTLLGEYGRFERGQKGTRFDRWLKKGKAA